MHCFQESLIVETRGRGTYDITDRLEDVIQAAGIQTGLCHVFIHHTSASLMLCENADPDVRHDLEAFMSRLVPDGDPGFVHRDEGPDDMPAHIRTGGASPSRCRGSDSPQSYKDQGAVAGPLAPVGGQSALNGQTPPPADGLIES